MSAVTKETCGMAWWCPKCRAGVEFGEEAWKTRTPPAPDADSVPLHYECGTELEGAL